MHLAYQLKDKYVIHILKYVVTPENAARNMELIIVQKEKLILHAKLQIKIKIIIYQVSLNFSNDPKYSDIKYNNYHYSYK